MSAGVLTSCGQLRLDPCTGMSKHWHGAVSLGHLLDAQAFVCAVLHAQHLQQQRLTYDLHGTCNIPISEH